MLQPDAATEGKGCALLALAAQMVHAIAGIHASLSLQWSAAGAGSSDQKQQAQLQQQQVQVAAVIISRYIMCSAHVITSTSRLPAHQPDTALALPHVPPQAVLAYRLTRPPHKWRNVYKALQVGGGERG